MFEASKSQLKELKQFQMEKKLPSTPSNQDRFCAGPQRSTAAADRAALALLQHMSHTTPRHSSTPITPQGSFRDPSFRKTLFGGSERALSMSIPPSDDAFRSRSAPRHMLVSPVDGRQYAPPPDYGDPDGFGDEMLSGGRVLSHDDISELEVGGAPAPAAPPRAALTPAAPDIHEVLDLQEVESFLAEERQCVDALSHALHQLDTFVEV